MRSSAGPGVTEVRFIGQQADEAFAYFFRRARYYVPTTERIIGKDPYRSPHRRWTRNWFKRLPARIWMLRHWPSKSLQSTVSQQLEG